MKKFPIYLFIILLSLLIGCSQTMEIPKDKVAPTLIRKLTELQQNHSDQIINFIGKCNSEVSPEIKEDLERSDISVHTVSKDIFTGSGNYKSILKIVIKDYIKWLETPRETHSIN